MTKKHTHKKKRQQQQQNIERLSSNTLKMNENDYPNNSLILIMNNKEPKELAQTW